MYLLRNAFFRIFVILFIGFILFYFIFRLDVFAKFLIFYIYLFGVAVFFVVKRRCFFNPRWLTFLVVVFYLIFSYFHFRGDSWDGLNQYLRNVLLLVNKTYIGYLEFPKKPYLVELFLAGVLRYGSLHLLNLTFGLVTLLTCLSILKLYKRLGFSSTAIHRALFILISSPIFLLLATKEFKIDLFLLLCATWCYILFIRFCEEKRYLTTTLLGLLLASAFLIKVSFLPFALILICLAFGELIYTTRSFSSTLSHSSALLVSFFIPIFLWGYFFGISIPTQMVFIDSIFSATVPQRVSLYRNPTIVAQCTKEMTRLDYGQFFPSGSLTQKIFQPYYYITNTVYNATFAPLIYSMYNPGPVLYFSFFSFFLLPLAAVFRRKRIYIYFYVFTLISFLIYFFFVGTVYWYILVLFPFFSLVLPLILQYFGDNTKLSNLVVSCIVFIGGIHFILAASYCFGIFDSTVSLDGPFYNSPVAHVYTMNKSLETITQDGFILDASRPYNTFFTFMSGSDTKVLESNYYFISSQKPLDAMYKELKANNIGYILTNNTTLSFFYAHNCLSEDKVLREEFLATYTTLIYSARDRVFLYRLN